MPKPLRPEALGAGIPPTDRLWYAAYASNMHLARLSYYLTGGRPPGAARVYPGCRDGRPPRRAVPVLLPGGLYFALESRTWTGGMGFYDPSEEGELPARAYLLSARQFADIAAQEMARAPGAELDLREALTTGRARLGPGRYETLVCAGLLDGLPVLTFTAPWRRADAALNRPAAAYLGHLAAGLREAHGWGTGRIAEYLSSRPGAAGQWTAAEVEGLLQADDGPPGPGRPRRGTTPVRSGAGAPRDHPEGGRDGTPGEDSPPVP